MRQLIMWGIVVGILGVFALAGFGSATHTAAAPGVEESTRL